VGRFLPLTQLYRKIELPPVLFTVATAPICVIGEADRSGSPWGELAAKQTEGGGMKNNEKATGRKSGNWELL
ncbi:hypothetical protein, partial [uncultured Dialister sp.]|uniref:hypothetical protein n=1 Tax=uncultured Dialister sp. TaxID=278064 RepID=UPI0025DB96C5